MSQEKKTVYAVKQDDDVPRWFMFLLVVILILTAWGACSATNAIWDLWKPNSLKNDKTYQLAYKQLMKRDKGLADLIDDLNKFKIEDLKQRKQRLLEDHLRISDETSNTIDEKEMNQKEETVHAVKQYDDVPRWLLVVILILTTWGTCSATRAILGFFELRSLKNKKIDEEIKLLKQELDSLKQNLEEKK